MFTRFAIAILAFAPFLSLANSEPAEASNVDITDVVGGACVPDRQQFERGFMNSRIWRLASAVQAQEKSGSYAHTI